MCMVALGVIQQYYIYLKTAIFFNKKVVTLLYLWLAAALAAWYNAQMKMEDFPMGYIIILYQN